MAGINRELAQQEIESWLDFKKINEKKREAQKEQIETLIDAVADGSLTLSPDKKLIQVLKFPTEGEMPVTKMEYAPRLKVSTIHEKLQGVKSTDADGRICAYIAALTNNPKNVVKAMDTEDYGVAQAVAIFFL